MSRHATSFASGCLKFNDSDFLPWLYWLKYPDLLRLSNLASGHGGNMRVTHGRVRVSMRVTSAPRCASCSVQYGPAHTQVKSATLMPESGGLAMLQITPLRPSSSIRVRDSFSLPPNTSALCCPSAGAGIRNCHGVRWYLSGAPGKV